MRSTLVCLFYVLSFHLFAQKGQSDLLWQKFNASSSDTQKVNILNRIFYCFSENNSDSARKIAEQALVMSFNIKYDLGKAASYNNLGSIYYYNGNNTKALINYLSAIRILENERGNKEQTIYHKKLLSGAYNNIGTIYQRQKSYVNAENYFNKSIVISLVMGDKVGVANSYNNIGTIKEEMNKYDEAIYNYELALKLKREANDTAGIPSTLINMGVIRMNQNKFAESQEYLEKALLLAKRGNVLQDMVLAYINLGDMFYLKKDYKATIPYYEKGIKICKEQKYDSFLAYAYKSLSLSYFRLKDFESAYACYDYSARAKDELNNKENVKLLNELETKYDSEVKAKEIKLLTSEKEISALELKEKKIVIYAFIGGSFLMVLFVFFVLNAYRQKRKANKELDIRNSKIEFAYKIIEEKQKEIVDSINYAKRIQYTLLAHAEFLKENLKEHFTLFLPKDIVSGDFYWATKRNNKFYLAVCDSTGHGVPGAFMSLLNIGFLSEAINEKGIEKTNDVLNYVRERLIENISKDGQKDGFDGILMCFDHSSKQITYAAANNAPLLVSNGEARGLEYDKMPVGIGEKTEPFSEYSLDLKFNDTLYLYTDGFADQFGGPKGKKFMYKRLKELIVSNADKPFEKQMSSLNSEFNSWRGGLEQVDDVLIIGIRL